MAPKKNRIKVEQEPQGSCPHPATPPPKPGTTRRQRQKKPKKLRRVRVWGHLTKLEKSAELYTPFAPFVRLVKEITESCSSEVKYWTPEALLWLQDLLASIVEKNTLEDLLRKLKKSERAAVQ